MKATRAFETVTMVVLPEHVHAVWHRPEGDADYPMRWSLTKAGFSRRLPRPETIRASREARRESGVWQRRNWEHRISDEADRVQHVDDIHINPVEYGHVVHAAD